MNIALADQDITRYPWLTGVLADLQDRYDRGCLPHALLLCGQRGIGKEILAQALARYILATDDKMQKLYDAKTHPDFFHVGLLEGKNTIAVEQIRQLSASLSLTSRSGQVAIISPADLMLNEAANALLKTLEEPPGNCILILVSHNLGRLMQTILSRCQQFVIPRPAQDVAINWLEERLTPDKDIGIPEILELASGSPLQARIFYEDKELIHSYHRLVDDLSAIYMHEKNAVTVAQNWAKFDINIFLLWLYRITTILIQAISHYSYNRLHYNYKLLKIIKINKEKTDLKKLFYLLSYMRKCQDQVAGNLNPSFLIEHIFIKWSRLSAG